MEDTDVTTQRRPTLITALAILQLVAGVALIASAVVGWRSISQVLGNSGISATRFLTANILYGLLCMAAGIGMWVGKPWGWWLAAFFNLYRLSGYVTDILGIPDLGGSPGVLASGVESFSAFQIAAMVGSIAVTVYWFSWRCLAYFGLDNLRRLRAILILFGVVIAIVVIGVVLPSGVDQELAEIGEIYEQGDVLVAIERLEGYLISNPESDIAWNMLGNASQDVDALEDAEAAYNRMLELNPERYQAWTGLGDLKRRRGDLDRALECYDEALAISPNNVEAHTSLAVVALLLYDDAKALEHAERAHELDSRNPLPAANLAVVYHYNGMYAQRDAMAAKAEELGYDAMDRLRMIFEGELYIRD